MADVIKGHNTSYARYEELINRRDELKKEAFQYHAEYVKVFGDLILELFRKKIECIRKKKTIDWHLTAILSILFLIGALFQSYAEGIWSLALCLLLQCCLHLWHKTK